MLAIAIDQTHDSARQARQIGQNSGYELPEGSGYDVVILVGGGLELRDAEGNTLASFTPLTVEDALGDADAGVISFAIPRALIGGGYDHWKYTVVAGAQDDHGGAGIGEFRTVRAESGQWHGGGATHPGANWYDVLTCP